MDAECARHRDRFSEYLDGELSKAERDAVETHLARCAECRRELEAWRRTISAVGRLPARPAPAGFAGRVMRQVAAAGRTPERRVVSVFWARVLPVAAMLLLVVGLTFTVQRHVVFEKGVPEARLAMARGPSVDAKLAAAHAPVRSAERLPVASPVPRVAALAAPAQGAGAPSEGVAKEDMVVAEEREGAPQEKAARVAVGFATGVEVFTGRKTEAAPALSWGAPGEGEVAVRRDEAGATGAHKDAEAALVERRAAAPSASMAVTVANAPHVLAPEPAKATEAYSLPARGPGSAAGAEGAAPGTLPLGGFGYGGGRGGKEVIFKQLGTAGAAGQPAPAQQLLTITGKDQAGLARQVVTVANNNGLPATLSLSEDKGGGAVEVRLSVPVERYDAVLRGLAGLTPPEAQNLANTAAATTDFFQKALSDYGKYQNAAALGGPPEPTAKRAVPSDALTDVDRATPAGPSAQRALSLRPARTPPKAPSEEVVREAEEPAAPVELVVRVVQPGSAQGK
jgi:anti-sigma factor RsiW